MAYPHGYFVITGARSPKGGYAIRDVNLSQENLTVQWQYVKRNLRKLGVVVNFDDFEYKAHHAIMV